MDEKTQTYLREVEEAENSAEAAARLNDEMYGAKAEQDEAARDDAAERDRMRAEQDARAQTAHDETLRRRQEEYDRIAA